MLERNFRNILLKCKYCKIHNYLSAGNLWVRSNLSQILCHREGLLNVEICFWIIGSLLWPWSFKYKFFKILMWLIHILQSNFTLIQSTFLFARDLKNSWKMAKSLLKDIISANLKIKEFRKKWWYSKLKNDHYTSKSAPDFL